MFQKIKNLTFIAIFSVAFWSCGGGDSSTKESEKKDSVTENTSKESEIKEEEKKSPEVSEDDIKAFMFSKEGTYGWKTDADEILYDFFKDGRLAVQGPGGESAMWEGKWSLTGDQLTMECKDCGSLKEKQVYTVKIDGENLVLGDKTYTRYAPK